MTWWREQLPLLVYTRSAAWMPSKHSRGSGSSSWSWMEDKNSWMEEKNSSLWQQKHEDSRRDDSDGSGNTRVLRDGTPWWHCVQRGATQPAPAHVESSSDGDDEIRKIASRLAAGIEEDAQKRAAHRWEILSFSCIAAWNLRYRRAAWQHVNDASRENTMNVVIRANLFGLCSDIAMPGPRETAEDKAEDKAAKERMQQKREGDELQVAAHMEEGAPSVPLWPLERSAATDAEILRGAVRAYLAAREAYEAQKNAGSGGSAAAAKALSGSVRDVVMWKCVKVSGADSEERLLDTLSAACDFNLDSNKDLKSQLLNSFHHIMGDTKEAFKSRSSQRRRRRPRKSRESDAPHAEVLTHIHSTSTGEERCFSACFTESDKQWDRNNMLCAPFAADCVQWEHGEGEAQTHPMQVILPSGLAPPGLAPEIDASYPATITESSQGFQMNLAPGCWEIWQQNSHADNLAAENESLRQENQTLWALVASLQEDMENLRRDTSQLRLYHVQMAIGPLENSQADGGPERIHVIEFSRHPQEFYNALARGASLKECRQALEKENHDWELQSGAKVFVHPHQYQETLNLIRGMNLRKQHVVAAESMLWNVMLSIHTLRSRLQVRPKSRYELGVVGNGTASSGRRGDEVEEWLRREEKRRAAVEAVKRTDKYREATERPLTPDPTDPMVSKRDWEKGVQEWRKCLAKGSSSGTGDV